MFGRFRKGVAPADLGKSAFENFQEAPIDVIPTCYEDGDNSILLDQYEHLVTDEQIAALEAEE